MEIEKLKIVDLKIGDKGVLKIVNRDHLPGEIVNEALSMKIKDNDVKEILACSGRTMNEEIGLALDVADVLAFFYYEGEIFGMSGITKTKSKEGNYFTAFGYGSDLIEEIPVLSVKMTISALSILSIFSKDLPMVCFTQKDYKKALKMMEVVGMKFDYERPIIGDDGETEFYIGAYV